MQREAPAKIRFSKAFASRPDLCLSVSVAAQLFGFVGTKCWTNKGHFQGQFFDSVAGESEGRRYSVEISMTKLMRVE